MSIASSPAYSSPEVALAREAGATTVEASEAADMWALGLISFELLTGSAVLSGPMIPREDIMDRLCGRLPLPWEEEGWETAETRRSLAGLKSAVMACLQRDPAQRPTAAGVRQSWRRLFEHETTNTK